MKLRTNLVHVGGLVEVDVDASDLLVLEKSEDALSHIVGSCSRGSVGGDANPDSDRTDDQVLSLATFTILTFFAVFILEDFLETNDINHCKTNLEILISKLYKDRYDNNNSNDDNNSDGDNNNDYDDSTEVAAAIVCLLSLLTYHSCDKLQFGAHDPRKVPCDLDPYPNQHVTVRRHVTYHVTLCSQ